jgi:hypothetical protein
VQLGRTAEWSEIAEKGLVRLELVGPMSVLVLATANRGAEPVQGTHLLGMVSSMF